MLCYALQVFPSNQTFVLIQIRLKGSNWIGFWVESIIQYDQMGSGPDLNINTILLFQQNWTPVVWYNLFDHGRPFLSLIPLSAECLRAISDKLGCTPICSQICKKHRFSTRRPRHYHVICQTSPTIVMTSTKTISKWKLYKNLTPHLMILCSFSISHF